MIAFDLDGVFISDMVAEVWYGKKLETMLEFRKKYMAPVFVPSFPYSIITGRPIADRGLTNEWVKTFLNKNHPVVMYHENEGYDSKSAMEYKLSVLNRKKNITMYIESDLDQVNFLVDNVREGVRVLHFETVVNQVFHTIGEF